MFHGLLVALALAAPPPAALSPMDAPTPSVVHSRPGAAPGPTAAPAGPGLDDAAHALAGFVAAGSGYAAGIALEADSGERIAAALAGATAASLAKEAFDAFVQDEHASGADLFSGLAGGALFAAIALLAGS